MIRIPAPRLKSRKEVRSAQTIWFHDTVLLVEFCFRVSKNESLFGLAFVDVVDKTIEPVCYNAEALTGFPLFCSISPHQVVVSAD